MAVRRGVAIGWLLPALLASALLACGERVVIHVATPTPGASGPDQRSEAGQPAGQPRATTTASAGSGTGPAPLDRALRVAFIGDQGLGGSARAVLELIKDEGADMVLHLGDFDYDDNPRAWESQINGVLGADFPYFAVVGNHDVKRWPEYQRLLLDRLSRIEGASCTGDYGVKAACTYGGVFFVLSGAGTMGSGHAAYIQEQLASSDAVWKVCAWHKNQRAMQVGGKDDDVGWEPYERCREYGAIIATGHEHSYSRTRTLSNTREQTVDPAWPDPANLRVKRGSTFVFVSGLGGASIREQERCLPAAPPYGCKQEWASIYTRNQGARYGALFIDFGVDGDQRKARGYFKNVNGEVIDRFEVRAE